MFGPNPIRPKSSSSQNGRDGNEVEIRFDGSYIQWRYKGFNKWINLISILDLKGEQGKPGLRGRDGKDGVKGDPGAQGPQGPAGTPGLRGPQGPMGAPGINGKDGLPGNPGTDGREIELNKSATHIQWRYVGDTKWQDLILLTDLKGPKGERGEKGDQGEKGQKGDTGAPGPRGPQGYPGAPGATASTFESVSKNIKAWDAAFAYTGSQLDSITYTNGAETIVKTFNYTDGKVTSIVLSGDTPSGIDLTKTLSYTGDQLTGVNYS